VGFLFTFFSLKEGVAKIARTEGDADESVKVTFQAVD